MRCALLLALALPALCAVPAAADVTLTTDPTARDVDAFAGVVVWSQAEADGTHRLMLRRGGETAVAPGAGTSTSVIAADLGRSRDGGVEVVYERCVDEECRLYRYDVEAGRERRVALVTPLGCFDSDHTVWRGRIAFVRADPVGECPRAGTYVRGRGGALRRLRRRVATGLDLQGDRLASTFDTRRRSALRVESLRSGDTLRLVRSSAGETFAQPAHSGSRVVWQRIVASASRHVSQLLRAPATGRGPCRVDPRTFAATAPAYEGRLRGLAVDGPRVFGQTTREGPGGAEQTLEIFELDPRPSFSERGC